jgi:integrase
MPRSRAGTFEAARPGQRHRGRLRLADGTKSERFDLPAGMSEKPARAYLAGLQAEEDRTHTVFTAKMERVGGDAAQAQPARGGETVYEYAKRWLKARESRISSIRDNKSHLNEHVLPVLGPLAIRAVTAKDVETFVASMDKKVTADEITAKTARNIWGTCSKMFDDATHAKPAEGLRCLDKDPTDGVRGPDDNDPDKLLQFLYPSELSSFLESVDVPLAWKVNVAIAVYLCLRDGEQRALKWPAVDLEHGVVTISETYDRRAGEDREGTKSGAARVVPIPEPLRPLLKVMREATGGKGLVCPLPSERTMARGLRRWLTNAGVDRPALHATTSVSKQIRWHDLRATGLTWLAVEGASPTMIRDVAGHTQTSMTDRYMRSAAVLRGGRFGQPFPPMPGGLLERVAQVWPSLERIACTSAGLRAGWTGLERGQIPYLFRPLTSIWLFRAPRLRRCRPYLRWCPGRITRSASQSKPRSTRDSSNARRSFWSCSGGRVDPC